MAAHSPITEFALAARAHDDALDLLRLTTGVARMERPTLDVAAVNAAIDALAEQLRPRVDPTLPPDRQALALRDAIGGEAGFRGDPERTWTADDSMIDQVLERRTGLPILLSVVWILLGERLGVPVAGVNYPGHFLVCVNAPGARIYLDPFAGGAVRDPGDLLARLGAQPVDRRALEPCGIRPIVTRILVNLKNLWVDQGAYPQALGAVDRILLIGGELAGELRDRGLICLHLDRPAEAARDFKRYLKVRPEADDRPVIEELLSRIGGEP